MSAMQAAAPPQAITLEAPLDPGVLVFAALEGEDEINQPFRYHVSLFSRDRTVAATSLLGQSVTVTVDRAAGTRHFNGIVADFAVTEVGDDFARYAVTLRPSLWLLSLTSDNRIFQGLSVIEIVEKVLRAHGIKPNKDLLTRAYPPRDYCVQYGESDLAFVHRLLEHEGILYFFDHRPEGHEMRLADNPSRLPAIDGPRTLAWSPLAIETILDADYVTALRSAANLRTRKFVHTDYDFEKPSSNLAAKARDDAPTSVKESEVYRYPGNYVGFQRGDGLAQLRLDELQGTRLFATATTNAPRLRPGTTFTLAEHPRAEENVAYVVLRARYDIWDEPYRSGREPPGEKARGAGCKISVDLQPVGAPLRPERRTPRPVMRGLQTAVVVGPSGQEIFTDKYSRVKVQFFWDRLGRKDDGSSCWVRVSAAWAGAGWGFIQVPRIGQEVIVDFLDGDPDQPIITGRVYNAEQMPPYDLPDNATQSGWKSESSPGGGGWNELRFEDRKGAEEVYFQAEKDHTELIKHDENRNIGNDWSEKVGRDARQGIGRDRAEKVGQDKTTEVGRDRTVKIGSNDTETVGHDRSLTVRNDETIHVVGNSSESIDKDHSQQVSMNQTVRVSLTRKDEVGVDETRVVGAKQSIGVGASRSVKVGARQDHSVGGDDGTSVSGGQTLSVGKDQTTSVAGKQALKVDGDQGTEVGGARLVKVGKSQAHDVAEDAALTAGKTIRIDAADEITLVCGDASLLLKKDGTIVLQGKDVTIDASGKINAKASGDMILKGSAIHGN